MIIFFILIFLIGSWCACCCCHCPAATAATVATTLLLPSSMPPCCCCVTAALLSLSPPPLPYCGHRQHLSATAVAAVAAAATLLPAAIAKTHVEHTVCFIHDWHINQTTRGGNHNCHTMLQITNLRSFGGSTINGSVTDVRIRPARYEWNCSHKIFK